jgi:hypothetical protein
LPCLPTSPVGLFGNFARKKDREELQKKNLEQPCFDD